MLATTLLTGLLVRPPASPRSGPGALSLGTSPRPQVASRAQVAMLPGFTGWLGGSASLHGSLKGHSQASRARLSFQTQRIEHAR